MKTAAQPAATGSPPSSQPSPPGSTAATPPSPTPTPATPFIAYSDDWLGFAHLPIAHLTIAVAFLGAVRDPVRNKWLVQFGLIACAGVVPLALIAGPFRGIPFGWSLVDMSFGVFGAVPLVPALRRIRMLESGSAGPAPTPAAVVA